jgi:hypothetical protein
MFNLINVGLQLILREKYMSTATIMNSAMLPIMSDRSSN